MNAGRALNHVVLELVKGGPERSAVEAGQVDAILDPATGSAFLLPAAQRWLLERAAQAPADGAPDRSAHATLDGLAIEVCALDVTGLIVSANRAWRDAASDYFGAGIAEGDNYLMACDKAHGHDQLDGIALAAGIRQVLAGERKVFRYEQASTLRPTRWFAFNVARATGDPRRAIVSREDITQRRRHELLLELQCAVARGLAEALNAATGLKAVIRAVCETQHWDCGRYFHFDPRGPVLRFHESWGTPTPQIAQFLRRSRDVAFHPGAGLKGRVYRTGQPLWVIAETTDKGVAPSALAPESDNDDSFIFPVLSEHSTLGVLAFSGHTVCEPDNALLQAVHAIGSQLGRFLERQDALETLRRNEARFRRLTDLSTDWYWEQDRELRFTEYVEAGVTRDAVLGKTLWDLPHIVPGSADWDVHRAQLAERWSFCDFEYSGMHADGHVRHYCISGEPIFDDARAFAGYRGTGMDITRRKNADRALRESEADAAAVTTPPPPR